MNRVIGQLLLSSCIFSACGIEGDDPATNDEPAMTETQSAVVITGQKSFQNSKSGMCMGVSGASRSQGALIQQFPCDGRANQKWTSFGADGVKNVNSGMCLAEASSTFGANIVQL